MYSASSEPRPAEIMGHGRTRSGLWLVSTSKAVVNPQTTTRVVEFHDPGILQAGGAAFAASCTCCKGLHISSAFKSLALNRLLEDLVNPTACQRASGCSTDALSVCIRRAGNVYRCTSMTGGTVLQHARIIIAWLHQRTTTVTVCYYFCGILTALVCFLFGMATGVHKIIVSGAKLVSYCPLRSCD